MQLKEVEEKKDDIEKKTNGVTIDEAPVIVEVPEDKPIVRKGSLRFRGKQIDSTIKQFSNHSRYLVNRTCFIHTYLDVPEIQGCWHLS